MIDANEKARRWLSRYIEHDRHAIRVLAGFLHSVPFVSQEHAEAMDINAMGQCLRAVIQEQNGDDSCLENVNASS